MINFEFLEKTVLIIQRSLEFKSLSTTRNEVLDSAVAGHLGTLVPHGGEIQWELQQQLMLLHCTAGKGAQFIHPCRIVFLFALVWKRSYGTLFYLEKGGGTLFRSIRCALNQKMKKCLSE